MLKSKIFVIASAIVLVFTLYNLPKIVIEDEGKLIKSEAGKEPASETNDLSEQNHNLQIPSLVQQQITDLRDRLNNDVDNKKNIIFADSLAILFKTYKKLDSAAKYFEIKAEYAPTRENWLQTGDSYYDAYSFAVDREKQQFLGSKARKYFEKVLEETPEAYDLEAKVAMTLVSTENPMQGILKLRAILEKDPDNITVIFNLGVLSMQSGQYDKAIERFERLIVIDKDNLQAQFYLGICYYESGEKEKAKALFLQIKELGDDPAIKATVEKYLKEIE